MYKLRIFEITDKGIKGIEGYDGFNYSILPTVDQWITLPNSTGDEEVTYKVIKVVIPLRSCGENDAEIYTVRLQSNGMLQDALYEIIPNLNN